MLLADPLWGAYPALADAIDELCAGARWCVTGASALLFWGDVWVLEIAKRRHWRTRDDGTTVVGVGAIGGSLERGETTLQCLQREAREEVSGEIEILSHAKTHIVYEERTVRHVRVGQGNVHGPALLTVSANRYRVADLPECRVLAIVTYLARCLSEPRRRDLHGVLLLPGAALDRLLSSELCRLDELASLSGVRVEAGGDLPDGAMLRPVWTMRSLQVLHQRGVAIPRP